MRNKQLIIVMIVSMAVVMLWSYMGVYLRAKYPHWFEPAQQAAQDQATPPTGQASGGAPATGPATQTAIGPTTAPARVASRGQVIGAKLGSFTLDQKPEPTDVPMAVE